MWDVVFDPVLDGGKFGAGTQARFWPPVRKRGREAIKW